MADLPPRPVAALSDRYRIERELGAGGMCRREEIARHWADRHPA